MTDGEQDIQFEAGPPAELARKPWATPYVIKPTRIPDVTGYKISAIHPLDASHTGSSVSGSAVS